MNIGPTKTPVNTTQLQGYTNTLSTQHTTQHTSHAPHSTHRTLKLPEIGLSPEEVAEVLLPVDGLRLCV